jgi:glucose/arabinose dehydrogenase
MKPSMSAISLSSASSAHRSCPEQVRHCSSLIASRSAPHRAAIPLAGSGPGRKRRSLLCGSVLLLSAFGLACDDDDGNDPPSLTGANTGSIGGAAGTSATTPPGAVGGSSGIDAGASVERDVFRPEERPVSPALAASLRAPTGFTVSTFATEVEDARMLAARGDFVYVTRPEPGDVLRLADTDGDGTADERATVASGWPLVHGIAFRNDQVYLATPNQVLLASVGADGGFGAPEVIIADLPDGGQHPLRTLGISPTDQLFISVGSTCDACADSNPENATLLVAALDGATRSTFARGLRNTIGFGWQPITNALWGMDHGSDWRGNDTPPEELNTIVEGADYGWPYCYGDRIVDPVIQDPPGSTKEAYCASTRGPILSTQAHKAPIGLTFYSGTSFPSEYRDDAFIAMHGSWNRFPPTGYEVVRLVFENGVPQRFEDFVTGFLIEDGAATFGRPAGITVAPDGSLLFSDDTSGAIYRVRYGAALPDAGTPPVIVPGPVPTPPGAPDAGADAGDGG